VTVLGAGGRDFAASIYKTTMAYHPTAVQPEHRNFGRPFDNL
jgi:hypothetical protein